MTTSEILVEQMITSLFRTNDNMPIRTNAAPPLNHVAKEVRQCDHNANLVGKIEVYVKDSAERNVYFDQKRVANSEDGKVSSLNVRPICPTR